MGRCDRPLPRVPAPPVAVGDAEAAGQAMSLTERQKRFVRAYRETGNATESARRAGYNGNDATLRVTASRLLANANVSSALKKAEEKAERASVASIDELHEFWSKVMR